MKKIVATLLCGVALFAANPLRRAPGFCLIDTSGQWQDLADYRGKIVVLEFMATTCPHCAAFSAVLNSLKLKYADKLAILAIANPPDNPQTMMQFANGHKLTYPLLYDQGQVAVSYVRSSGIDLPAVYLIDAGGLIRNQWQYGVLTKDVFEGNGLSREIDKMLAGAPAAVPAKK
ncbi:MAG: TlpA disulfide reductase family protein [Candidatus Solibacter sp.]|nr:TlpA disulfide reductase family protein [Candidatus Solibacter sp.]